MTDADLLDFLRSAKADGLVRKEFGKTGLIFIKDNAQKDKHFLLDRDDNSVMRSIEQFEAIFEDAGYNILKEFE